VISPFFGFPFFPVGPFGSFYTEPLYSAPVYAAPEQMPATSDNDTDDLRTQIDQLTKEVQDLRVQLAMRTGELPQASAREQKPPAVVLVLKDGRRIEAPGYALVGKTLWILDSTTAAKIPITDVDVEATRKANLDRGVNVVIPAS
jgi:hypothetical protein